MKGPDRGGQTLQSSFYRSVSQKRGVQQCRGESRQQKRPTGSSTKLDWATTSLSSNQLIKTHLGQRKSTLQQQLAFGGRVQLQLCFDKSTGTVALYHVIPERVEARRPGQLRQPLLKQLPHCLTIRCL